MKVTCETCGKEFSKKEVEIKKTKHNYCSRKCYGQSEQLKDIIRTRDRSNGYDIAQHAGNQRDEYSGLREFLRRIRRKRREKIKQQTECDLTLEYLKEVWDKQEGKCAYTGIELFLPHAKNKPEKKWKLASLDRIDSSIGYMQGNVEFVSANINYAKSSLSKEEFIEFLDILVEGHGVEPCP